MAVMQLDVVIAQFAHLSELKLPHHKVRQITFSQEFELVFYVTPD